MPAPEFIILLFRRYGLRVRGEAGGWALFLFRFNDEQTENSYSVSLPVRNAS